MIRIFFQKLQPDSQDGCNVVMPSLAGGGRVLRRARGVVPSRGVGGAAEASAAEPHASAPRSAE